MKKSVSNGAQLVPQEFQHAQTYIAVVKDIINHCSYVYITSLSASYELLTANNCHLNQFKVTLRSRVTFKSVDEFNFYPNASNKICINKTEHYILP